MNRYLCLILLLVPAFRGPAQGILLNELSADVTNSVVDNYGEFEDWIEVYNTTGSDINLAGWYLTDNPDKPLKWRIPDANPRATTVMSGSYLILWADKDTLQGPDHLGFALKKDGESLFLFRPSKAGPILEDSVRFGKLPSDQSYGRCPERNNQWIVFKHPTPGKPNHCKPEKKRAGPVFPRPVPPGIWEIEPMLSPSSVPVSVTVTINEICSNNKLSLSDEIGEFDDWIELYNSGTTAVNIAGWYINDTANNSLFHRIPSYDLEKTRIPPGGYLILWADGQSAQGPTHLPFRLEKNGEMLLLARLINGEYVVMDEVIFPRAKNDVTYGRIPDGSGQWRRLSDPTPLAPNKPARVLAGFVLNELMAVSGQGMVDEYGEEEDWIEFFNPTDAPVDLGGLYLTDTIEDPIRSHITVFSSDSTTVPPGGHLVMFADNDTWQGARHLSFKLSAKGGEVTLFQPDGITEISRIIHTYQAGEASLSRYPDGGDSWVFGSPTPGQPNQYPFKPVSGLYINELMASNESTATDTSGLFEDWIEIYNSNDFPVHVGGLYISDSLQHPMKFRIPDFPDSTSIAPKGFMVFVADNHPELGIRHLDLKLDAEGESVGLAQFYNGRIEFLDSITYPPLVADESFGRFYDAGSDWKFFKPSTPGRSNTATSSIGLFSMPGSIEIYPNPVVNRLTIRIFLIDSSPVLVDVFSGRGEKILRENFMHCREGWNDLAMENAGSRMGPGLYFLRIGAGRLIAWKNFLVIK